VRPHHTVNPIQIGQRQRRQAEGKAYHQLIRMARAFETKNYFARGMWRTSLDDFGKQKRDKKTR
jgi:hypothetical protein